MVSFPRYEKYKDSGVEWLGKIPEHWGMLPIRAIFEDRREKNTGEKTDFILSVMKDRGIIPYDEKGSVGNNKSENIENYKLVYPGDLVINKMNAIIGSLGISPYYGALSQVYFVLYPRDKVQANEYYFGYLFQIKSFQRSLIKIAKGIMELRESIDFNQFKKLLLPIPSIKEQKRIVEFLDRKTEEIDRAIAHKKRLIELLEEQKTILINQAVTKGLNPNVPMKDSGIEWLGEIPEHWEIKKIKYVFDFIGGATPSKENLEFWNGGIIWISPRDMKERYLSSSYNTITRKALEKTKINLLPQKTLLIVVRGMILARKIPIALTTNEVTINQDMKGLIVKSNKNKAEYLCMLFEGINKVFSSLLEEAGHGTKTLPTENLGNLIIPLPTTKEQEQIVDFIQYQEKKFISLSRNIENQIKKIKELKQILIAEAVTGKIKI